MSNPTMVDRVARAIYFGEAQHFIPGALSFDVISMDRREQYREMAVAAIDAMREPTDYMSIVGGAQSDFCDLNITNADAEEIYKAMIKAALEQKDTEK